MAGARSRWGSGSIRKRPGRDAWELRFSAGLDPVTKRYRYVSRTFRGTKKQAEAELATLLSEVSRNEGGHTGTDATMGELIEQWLDLRRDTLSVTTYEGYLAKSRSRIIPAVGEIAVRKLTVRDIDVFYRTLSREAGLAPSTVKQMHNVLTGSLDQAVKWGWRADNPAKWATLPAARPSEVRPPSPADVMAAIAQADHEFATFLRLSAAVGGRRGEIAALRWSAVDLEAGELILARGLVENRDREIFEKDTKTHQARRIALDAGTVEVLRQWREAVEARASQCGVTIPAGGFVFSCEPDGSAPWRPYRWTSAWRRVREKAGIDASIRLHDLRHFAATRLLDAGVPVKTVSGRLGHARAATTLNVYAHFIPASDRTAADVMGRILDGDSDGDGDA